VARAARASEIYPMQSTSALHPLGKGLSYRWNVNVSLVDMSMSLPEPRRPITACEPQSVTVDLNRTR
jgi:hypothetical protein